MPFDGTNKIELFKDLIRDRRRRAAEILRAIPEREFDLSTWVNDHNGGEHKCGTTACAMGWLALKNFEGLRLDYRDPRLYNDLIIYPDLIPVRDEHEGEFAAMRLFALTEERADDLFIEGDCYEKPYHEITPSDVADALVKSHISLNYMDEELELLNAV